MGESTWVFVQNIFLAAGGLGLFLYGMTMMSDGLERMAGDRMRVILERATSTRVKGILVGAVVTSIIQSSSATTVLAVGFVNAGMMTLTQAISVIMGANVGTTITAQVISFRIDPIAPLMIFIGLLMHMFFKKKKIKNLGFVLLGFGILFFGISVMGEPLKEFSQNPSFQSILTSTHHPILALLVGIAFTAIIQSSSATTGIIVAMYLSGVELPFITAVFLVLGSNIGTCITAMLSSLAANRESKRAALSHVLFNTIGCIFFGMIIMAFPGILTWIQTMWPDGARQVAMFHTIFNLTTVILLVSFTKQLARLVQAILPVRPDEKAKAKQLVFLTPGIMQTPSIAVAQAHREVCRMGKMAADNLTLAVDAFSSKDQKKAEAVLETEETIDYLNHQITSCLVQIRGKGLSSRDIEQISMMLRTVSDIERIGDHAENIAEYAAVDLIQDLDLSAQAYEELHTLSQAVVEAVSLAQEIYENNDALRLPLIASREQSIDDLAENCIENHIDRLQNEQCDPRSGVVFTEIIIDLERCADHAMNIAFSILGESKWTSDHDEIDLVLKSGRY